jgi:cephalosporin-C deacetylase-like acetyl esterase
MFNPYIYNRQDNGVNCRLVKETSNLARYTVDFASAFPARYLGNNRVKGEYFLPRVQGRVPLCIIVHGMGDHSLMPCRLIARTLVKKGIACFILFLVFHRQRVTESIRARYPRLTADEWFESYQVSVTDVHQVVDWAVTRPEIDPQKIAVTGISFGSFVASIAMALDNRLTAGVLVESGGNSEKITRHSFMLSKVYKNDLERYRKNQQVYLNYLKEVAEKGFEKVDTERKAFLNDPLTFATLLYKRPLLMINAQWDEMIPRVSSEDLWEAVGRPAIKWYPATHASLWMLYPFIGPVLSKFLTSVYSDGKSGTTLI